MAIKTANDLISQLRGLQLLKSGQLEDVIGKLKAAGGNGKTPDARTVALKLVQAGWLTSYQVNQLLQGRGQGLVLGSYVLLELLGEGGMGQVFKAKHKNLDRIVALKLIRKERLGNLQAVKRFHREIEAAAKLNHPHIVMAYDADQIDNTHFFTMEYVEGIDLYKLIKTKGPLPASKACDYIRQSALGLQHAFEQGLVHRDIKPHNLLLTRPDVRGSSTVKILDMGLARTSRPDEDDASSTLTRDGAVVGTLDYIAPEQAMDSHNVDIRGDLYSLGCTLYFLLTGQVPFPGGDALGKLMKHKLEEPIPVEKLRPEVPAATAAVVRKLMAKKPEDRYQMPGHLARALSTGVTATPPVSVPDQPAIPNPPLWRRAIIATLVLAWRFLRMGGKVGWISKGVAGFLLLLLPIVFLSGSGDGSSTVPPDGNPPESKTNDGDNTPATNIYITNSIGMKLRYIQPGNFMMGSTAQQIKKARDYRFNQVEFGEEMPQHKVAIAKDFYIGVYEVTQEEYKAIMGDNPSRFRGKPDHPVEMVTWGMAREFCIRLSSREKQAGRRYRLPTEAEWEYACRAGTSTIFYGGGSLSPRQANFNAEQPFAAKPGLKVEVTVKVGSYEPNPWGLYDMYGNVWEWCQDGPRKYTQQSLITDPRGPKQSEWRVMRGGNFHHDAWACRSAARISPQAGMKESIGGFRVVMQRMEGDRP